MATTAYLTDRYLKVKDHPVCALKIDFNDDVVAHVPRLPRVMRTHVFQHGVSVGLIGQGVVNVIWLPQSLRKPSNQEAIQVPKWKFHCRPAATSVLVKRWVSLQEIA